MTNTRRGCSYHSVSLPLRLAKKREFDPAMDILSDIFQRILLLFGDCHRLGIVGGGAVTQLAAVITATIPYRAVGGERHAVQIALGDFIDAAQKVDAYRRGSIDVGAVSHLAAAIVAPCPHRAVIGQRYRMAVTGRDRDGARQAH